MSYYPHLNLIVYFASKTTISVENILSECTVSTLCLKSENNANFALSKDTHDHDGKMRYKASTFFLKE